MSLIIFFNPHTFRNKRFHTFFNITFRVITIVAITALSFVLFECKPCNTIFYFFIISVVTFISDIGDLSPFFIIMNNLMFLEVAKSANVKQVDQLKHRGSSNLKDNKQMMLGVYLVNLSGQKLHVKTNKKLLRASLELRLSISIPSKINLRFTPCCLVPP